MEDDWGLAGEDGDESGLSREIDVNGMRNPVIALYSLSRVDDAYTFYYDETNNIRRLHVTDAGLNVREPMCFVLGGVAHRGPPRALDVARLKKAVRLQPTAKELKLAHLGKGDFLDLLKSCRVEVFLDWLTSENLLVHFSAVDPLYWSTVDIVDSIISHEPMAHMQRYHMQLKADLFTILAADVDDIADLFHRYSYPDVGEANRRAFVAELLQRLEDRDGLLGDFEGQVLKGVLQGGARREPLLYFEDGSANTLLDSFAAFFIHRICLFKNAQHRLDVEPFIQTRLEGCVFRDGDRVLDNFQFVNSQTEPGVQASDALIGLVGKLYSYLVRTPLAQLMADRRALTPGQLRTLAKLNGLLDRSDAETPALLHRVASVTAMQAGRAFLDGP